MGHDHISDGELLVAAGGELAAARASQVHDHLAACQLCRMRSAALQQTLANAIQAHRREVEPKLPLMEASRTSLRERLARAAEASQPSAWHPPLAWAAAAMVLIGLGALLAGWPARRAYSTEAEFAPNAAWTPGSAGPLTMSAVCAAPDRDEPGPVVSASLAQQVFRRYGIRNPSPRSYEVDYLIPPALGGTADPRNLWPQPYSAGVWNAHVKDALEDRLRSLVCEGKLDLATAQRDLAGDWIAAYKKYFHTNAPLLDHVAFVKDRPWE
jgi:hypothetical protein